MPDDLDSQVRRFDEDRWLASRFASPELRARLIAIYALNHEIARAGEVVSTPQLADIRLAWWRDAIDEIYAAKPARAHPALAAFAGVAPHVPDRWSEILESRKRDEAFASWSEVGVFIERTARAIMSMALGASELSDADHRRLMPVLTDVALAWGHVALARSSWFAARAPGPLSDGVELAAAAYRRAKSGCAAIPASAFPAIGYVTLVPGYVRALRRMERETPLLTRQFRLLTGAATGRL